MDDSSKVVYTSEIFGSIKNYDENGFYDFLNDTANDLVYIQDDLRKPINSILRQAIESSLYVKGAVGIEKLSFFLSEYLFDDRFYNGQNQFDSENYEHFNSKLMVSIDIKYKDECDLLLFFSPFSPLLEIYINTNKKQGLERIEKVLRSSSLGKKVKLSDSCLYFNTLSAVGAD